MQDDERAVFMTATTDFNGYIVVFFKNGKCAKIALSSYRTKLNRKKLVNAYSDSSELVAIYHIAESAEFVLTASNSRTLIVNTGVIAAKTTKNTAGVSVMTLKAKTFIEKVVPFSERLFEQPDHYRTKTLPAAGSFLRDADNKIQMQLS